jgi:TRAP-type C4-dicarboxylate transport system substrate-binding protein
MTYLSKSVALSAAIVVCAAVPALSQSTIDSMAPVTLTMQQSLGAGSQIDLAVQAFQKEVTTRTNGKVTFENFYSFVLLPPNDILRGVGDGLLDIGWTNTAYNPQDLPAAQAFFQLTAAVPAEFPRYPLVGTAAMDAVFRTNEVMLAEFSRSNVEPLVAYSTFGGYDVYCTDPVPNVESLAGRTVRAPGVTWAGQATALGMVPVQVASNEIYEALQRGLVDCGINTLQTLKMQSIWEVAKHLVPGVFAANPGQVWIMNKDRLAELPEEVQAIIREEASGIVFDPQVGLLPTTLADFSVVVGEAPSHGVVIESNAGFEAALATHNATVTEGVVDYLKSVGIADPTAFLADYEAEMAHWDEVLTEEIGMKFSPARTNEEIANAFINFDRDKVTAFVERVRAESF